MSNELSIEDVEVIIEALALKKIEMDETLINAIEGKIIEDIKNSAAFLTHVEGLITRFKKHKTHMTIYKGMNLE